MNDLVFSAPQIVVVSVAFFDLLVAFFKNGSSEGVLKFRYCAAAVFISWLLYNWGGFWEVLNWPQIVMSLMFAWRLAYYLVFRYKRYMVHNFFSSLINSSSALALLYFGGFFAA